MQRRATARKGHLIKKIAEKMTGTLLVIVPRVNLVADLAGRIDGAKIFCASLKKKEVGQITVGTIHSLRKFPIKADLIIWDECHSYKKELLESVECKYMVGLTATNFTSEGWIHDE